MSSNLLQIQLQLFTDRPSIDVLKTELNLSKAKILDIQA